VAHAVIGLEMISNRARRTLEPASQQAEVVAGGGEDRVNASAGLPLWILMRLRRFSIPKSVKAIAPSSPDLQLLMADQRFGARQIRPGIGGFGLSTRRNRLDLLARGAPGEDHRMCGGKIGRQRFAL